MSRRVMIAVAVAAGALLMATPASAEVKKVQVDCTPGFWKNHLGPSPSPTGGGPNYNLCQDIDLGALSMCSALSDRCGADDVCSCSELITLLSAELGSPRADREAAQTCLNTYFAKVLMFDPCPD